MKNAALSSSSTKKGGRWGGDLGGGERRKLRPLGFFTPFCIKLFKKEKIIDIDIKKKSFVFCVLQDRSVRIFNIDDDDSGLVAR